MFFDVDRPLEGLEGFSWDQPSAVPDPLDGFSWGQTSAAPSPLAAVAASQDSQGPYAPAPSLPTDPRSSSDPYAAIRRISASYTPRTRTIYDADGGAYQQPVSDEEYRSLIAGLSGRDRAQLGLSGNTWSAQLPPEWGGKYFSIGRNLSGHGDEGWLHAQGIQQPGAHKYDTYSAFYKPEADGSYSLVGDPWKTRETSSLDGFRDFVEKAAVIGAAMYGAGQLLGPSAGAGAGAGASAGGTGAGAAVGGTGAASSGSGLGNYFLTGAAEGSTLGGAAVGGGGAGAVGAGSTSSLLQGLQGLGVQAGRNALVNGLVAEAAGGDFMDGARSGALGAAMGGLGGLAGGYVQGAAAGLGAPAASALGGATSGLTTGALTSLARTGEVDWDRALIGAAAGGTGAGVRSLAGGAEGALLGSLASGTTAGVLRGQDLGDALTGTLSAMAVNPNTYDNLARADFTRFFDAAPAAQQSQQPAPYGDFGELPQSQQSTPAEGPTMYDDYDIDPRGSGATDISDLIRGMDSGDWGQNSWLSPDPGYQSLDISDLIRSMDDGGGWGQNSWLGSPPTYPDSTGGNSFWDSSRGVLGNIGDIIRAGGGWLGRVASGDATARNQANFGIGVLGLLNALRTSGQQSGSGAVSPEQLRAMVQPQNSTWNEAQRAASERFFSTPLTQYKAPSASEARSRYGVDPRNPGYAEGGGVRSPLAHLAQARHVGPGYVASGEGGGQDDLVPAALSPGEYVFDAEAVSALGDGSNEAGARMLDEMRENIRQHKRGGPVSSIPPRAKRPEDYLSKR